MTYRVPLEIANADLRDDDLGEAIATSFGYLAWTQVDGVTVATAFVEEDPEHQICDLSHRLAHSPLGVRVSRVHPELVSITDIAARVDMSRETVRLWVHGKRGPGGFPPPEATIGGDARGGIKVWDWPRVNTWLQGLGLDDGHDVLTLAQVARLNAYFLRADEVVAPVPTMFDFGMTWAPAVGAARKSAVYRQSHAKSVHKLVEAIDVGTGAA